MEINFKRTYIPKHKRYALGEISAAQGFAMEITELRPRLAEGRLQPGEMLVILFAVTQDEYALRETDPKQLDRLADRIRKAYPADRLIGWLVRDLKGAVIARDVRLEMTPTIDENGVFRPAAPAQKGRIDDELNACARLQKLPKDAPEGVKQDWIAARKAAAQALTGLDSFFAAYDLLTNGRWPAQSFDGRIELFTSAERAENAHRQVTAAGGVDIWQIREIGSAEYGRFFGECGRFGMELIRVDNGFSAAELRLEDISAVSGSESGDRAALAADAHVFNLMLREVQYGVRWGRMKQEKAPENAVRGALESTMTMQNFARREIGNAVLYIVCPGTGVRECTQAAYGRIGEGRIVKADACIRIADKRDQKNFLAAFTSVARAAAFASRMNPPAHPVAAVFDDVIQRAGSCEGIVLNVDDLGYRILKADFGKVLELRGKPPIAVRIRAEAEAQSAESTGTAAPSDAGASLPNPDAALPDPDKFLPKRAPAERSEAEPAPAEQPEAESAPAPTGTAEKKGFLKRLFGK